MGENGRVRIAVLAAVLLLVASFAAVGCKGGKGAEDKSQPPVKDRVVEEAPPEPVYWPLTGLEADQSDALGRRPLSVKIENSREARPQTGLQSADVVYEVIAEGGVTRFNAIFHSALPEEVGPVRSMRFPDAIIVPQYDALFAFSGGNNEVAAEVKGAGIDILSEDYGVSAPFRRASNRSAPHNLYMSISKAFDEAAERGYRIDSDVAGLTFDRNLKAPEVLTASSISVPFSAYNKVGWTYDAASGTYLRSNEGNPFTDTVTGAQVSAKNVVVIWADYQLFGVHKTYKIGLVGSGTAAIFRNGERVDGVWSAEVGKPPVFKSADGSTIALAAGNTWFQIVPTDVAITAQ